MQAERPTVVLHVAGILRTIAIPTVLSPFTDPGQPCNAHVEGVGATILQVTWEAPLDNGGRPILIYRITLMGVIPPFPVDFETDTFSLLM